MSEQALQRTALTVVCLGAFITPLMLSAVNVAIPTIAQGLTMDAITASWVALAYLLSSSVFLLPFGRLGDMYGRKRMFLTGMITVTIASILASIAPSALFLILGRMLQGMGAAMLFGTGIAILSSVFPPEKRGRVLGLSVSSVYLGLTCGPFAGGWVTQHFGWRSVFIFHIPVVVLVIVLALLNLKGEWRGPSGQKFDFPGTFIYGATVIALMYGFSTLPGPSGFCPDPAERNRLCHFFQVRKAPATSPLQCQSVFRQPGVYLFLYSCVDHVFLDFFHDVSHEPVPAEYQGVFSAVCRADNDLPTFGYDVVFPACRQNVGSP